MNLLNEMKTYYALLMGLWLFQCTSPQLPEGKGWKGEVNLPTKGIQRLEARIDWDKKKGLFMLPDVIPIPLDMEQMNLEGNQLTFIVGFRSGSTPFTATLHGDSISGVMIHEKFGEATFWMVKEDGQIGIFNLPKPGPEEIVKIRTNGELETELRVKDHLKAILVKHELEPFLYTKEILIQEGAIPHSHPVLTLNTAEETEVGLLSVFLHEQMHWYGLHKNDQAEGIIEEIKARYPEVPIAFPKGAGSVESAHLHLLVNFLEYQTLQLVIGEDAALKEMKRLTKGTHYTWIYQTVLEDYEKLYALAEKYDLNF